MAGTPNDFRTPMARARGLGAAKHGVGHFIAERVSGIALIPLALWAAFSGPMLAKGDFATAAVWLSQPLNAVLAAAFVVVGFFHLRLTMQVVIEDYVEGFVGKSALLMLNLFVCVLGAGLGVFAILKVALLGGAL
ncbi:MAG TPA: succinate dehydrogenase, hydrophobic membrane anchor protein [Caulobacter sp.]|mgnify:CR=1 FL=1|nr:succinate dehydrogenase, hydrophobic membrane anchor protein [Caulobacter sp.]